MSRALTKYYTLHQADGGSNDKFIECFKNVWKTAEAAAGIESLGPKVVRTSATYMNMEQYFEKIPPG